MHRTLKRSASISALALAIAVVACGGSDSGGVVCGTTRCAAGQTCGNCCGQPTCGVCAFACAADAAAVDAGQDGAPDASGEGGSCPPSCRTSADCATCPTPSFGGWSCGADGICHFMG